METFFSILIGFVVSIFLSWVLSTSGVLPWTLLSIVILLLAWFITHEQYHSNVTYNYYINK